MGTQNSALDLTAALETLGQNVFHPPSVKGWDGGQTWLNGQTLLFRQNLALDMCRRPSGYRKPATAVALAEAHGKNADDRPGRVLPGPVPSRDVPADTRSDSSTTPQTASKQKLPSYWTAQDAAEHRVISLCHLVMTLPEYQLRLTHVPETEKNHDEIAATS